MLVSPQILECVCFVCTYANDEYVPVGTGFFVGIHAEGMPPNRRFRVVITALHVLAQLEMRQAPIFLRINTPEGGVDYVEMPFDRWVKPDQNEGPTIDAAACLFPVELKGKFSYKWLGVEQAATPQLLRAEHIGVGNDVYLAGLFVNHAGQERNEPIIRSGFIAAMPRDEVLTTQGYMPLYLIEARSLGGLSGSPVLVDAGLHYHDENGQLHTRRAGDAWYLLGVVRGHWDVPPEATPAAGGIGERINMGIATVVPVELVLPLAHEAVRRNREEAAQTFVSMIPDDPAQAAQFFLIASISLLQNLQENDTE